MGRGKNEQVVPKKKARQEMDWEMESRKNTTKKTTKNQKKVKSSPEIAQQKRHVSMVASSFLLIFIVIGIIAGCLVTPVFDVTQIEAQDGVHVTAAEIRRYFSEAKGKNTFLISTSEIAQNIQSHPYIYRASVKRKLPNTLTVTYEERVPYSQVAYLDSYVIMDYYGSILEIKTEKEETLPVLYDMEVEKWVPGEKLTGEASLKYENAVYLLETVKHTQFSYTISEIHYTASGGIRFFMKELGVEVLYGSVEQAILNEKVTYLNEILKELVNKKGTTEIYGTLDISSDNYSEKVIFK